MIVVVIEAHLRRPVYVRSAEHGEDLKVVHSNADEGEVHMLQIDEETTNDRTST